MITLAIVASLSFVQDSAKPAPSVPAAKIVPIAAAAKATAPITEPTLTPGSPAVFPAIAHFVKGDKVDAFAPGKVCVLEFWATWCGPCKVGMPHLSHLQEEYKDKGVTIIGISDEPLATVEAFLALPEWAAKTQYTLATDPDRSAYDNYMKAAMQNGIPTAFIVKDSVVQWIGHPQTMDNALAQIVDGTWDIAAAKTQFAVAAQAKMAQRRLSVLMRDARSNGKFDEVLMEIDEMIAKGSPDTTSALEMQKFQLLVGPANQPEAGYTLGKHLVASMVANKDTIGLNQISWFVIDTSSLKNPDYRFALDAAKEANSISQGKEGAILDTLAAAYWKTGDKSRAITTQKEAIAATEEGPMRDQMKKALEEYTTPASPAKAG